MSIEQMQIPVAEMNIEKPTEGPKTEYAITPDGTVVEAEALKENMESFQEAIQ